MSADNVVNLTDQTFKSFISASSVPVLVDFWAPWCQPCRSITPILEELGVEWKGKVAIAKMNVDEQKEIAAEYGIRSIPSLLMFKNGQKVDTKVGAQNKATLEAWLENYV